MCGQYSYQATGCNSEGSGFDSRQWHNIYILFKAVGPPLDPTWPTVLRIPKVPQRRLTMTWRNAEFENGWSFYPPPLRFQGMRKDRLLKGCQQCGRQDAERGGRCVGWITITQFGGGGSDWRKLRWSARQHAGPKLEHDITKNTSGVPRQERICRLDTQLCYGWPPSSVIMRIQKRSL